MNRLFSSSILCLRVFAVALCLLVTVPNSVYAEKLSEQAVDNMQQNSGDELSLNNTKTAWHCRSEMDPLCPSM